MTQRIFDMDNPRDVKDLFNLLPNKIQKIRWASEANIFIDDENNTVEFCGLICIAWRDKTEITRPMNESQLIGKLCWFWDKDEQPTIGVLNRIVSDVSYKYINADEESYKFCRPARRSEVQFADDDE